MTDRHRTICIFIFTWHQHRHRSTYDIASPDHHTMLPLSGYFITFQQLYDSRGSCRQIGRQTGHHLADIAGMKSIHIFIGIDSHQHFMLRDMTRQRQLYDITVYVGILIQLIDDSQQLFFGNIGRIPHFGALETDLLASLYFAGHISFTRRIVTYQNGHQMRCFGSGCFHPFYFICQLLFYLSCNFFPIY